MRRVIRHTFGIGTRLVSGVVGALLILALAAAWRMSTGPVSLAFLAPYLEETLNAGRPGARVDLSGAELVWGGLGRTLEVRAQGVRLVRAGGQVALDLPEMSLGLSAGALVSGTLAPTRIELIAPRLHLLRRTDGSLSVEVGVGAGPYSGDLVSWLVAGLAAAPASRGPLGYLNRLTIRAGALTIDDQSLETTWRVPRIDLELNRDLVGIAGEASLAVELAGEVVELDLAGTYRSGSGAEVSVALRDLVAARLAAVTPWLQPLAQVDLPVSGRLFLGLGEQGRLDRLAFDLAGGRGSVGLPEPRPHLFALEGLRLKGRSADRLRRIEFEEVAIDTAEGRLVGSGEVDGLGGEVTLAGEASFENVPFARLDRLWPVWLAPKVRPWVLANIREGRVDKGSVTVSARTAAGLEGLTLTALSGSMSASRGTVDYLHPMARAEGVSASATFGRDHFFVTLKGGRALGQTVQSGTVNFKDLDTDNESAEADLVLKGALDKALALADQEPLRLMRFIDLDPLAVRGQALTRLAIRFPLTRRLTAEMVEASASASLSGVRIPAAILGQDVERGDLALSVDRERMAVEGRVRLLGVPAWMRWRRNFAADAPFRDRYTLDSRIDHHQLAQIGVDIEPFVEGVVPTHLTVTRFADGGARMTGNVDLTSANVVIPSLQWEKKAGVEGQADFSMRLEDGRPAEVDGFVVRAGDLYGRGAVAFVPGTGKVERIEIRNFTVGETSIEGMVYLRPDGEIDADVRGPSLDMTRLLARAPAIGRALPAMMISGNFQRVWIGPGRALTNVAGAAHYDGTVWRSIVLEGGVGEKGSIKLRLDPENGHRFLSIESNDAGATLGAFDIYDKMRGGTLRITGRFNDTHPDRPLVGVGTVSDFRVVKAPGIAKVLSIASLTGILESLAGDGIAFGRLTAPFALVGNMLELKNARAWGPSIGITLQGLVDLDAHEIDIEGTLVPAYVLNSVLGNIPLLGGIITGGEVGGGIFAATYKMRGPLSEPKVSVNPLAALAPGVLRRLFDIFDQGGPLSSRREGRDAEEANAPPARAAP